jgi:cytidine deaminase
MTDVPASLHQLLREAESARNAAYAPYSNFKVGAAVRTRSGKIYSGCNIENASYGLSICAERVAVFKAVAAGDGDVVELAVSSDAATPATPCGACRQVLHEFGAHVDVLLGNLDGARKRLTLEELFPFPFELKD